MTASSTLLERQIAEQLAVVHERIARAAARSGRRAESVQLIGVTKTHGLDVIRAAYACGLRHFGENRVEEAEGKIAALEAAAMPGITWHMIGHIQSRKTADIAALFSRVHSVARMKVASRLSQACVTSGQTLPVLLEVNLSGEESKDGYDLSRWPEDAGQLETFCTEAEQVMALPALMVEGLMTMAPYSADPEAARPVFRRLRALRDTLRDRFGGAGWDALSMGMSGDYEVAIEEGATMIRLGTILFGTRPPQP